MYQPKRHAGFTDSSARLAEENILFKESSFLDSLSGGVVGNAPELTLEAEAWITKFSRVGCWVRKLGSPGEGQWWQAIVLCIEAPVQGFDQARVRRQ